MVYISDNPHEICQSLATFIFHRFTCKVTKKSTTNGQESVITHLLLNVNDHKKQTLKTKDELPAGLLAARCMR